MKKVLSIVLFLCILLFLYFCYFKYIKKVDYIPFGDYKVFMMAGDSMRPTIQNGDAIIIKEGEYNTGDIVCYEAYGVLNIREIGQIDETGIHVKENYTGNEDTIQAYRIIGKMIKRIPYLGNVLRFLTEPFTFLFVGILIGTYFVFVYNRKTP